MHSIFRIKDVLNIMSVKAKSVYKTIPTNNGTDKTLYSKADLKSKLKTEINPLVRPQPTHDIPKILLIGQMEPPNIFVMTNRITKQANPTVKDRRVCFFLGDMFLKLKQRLSIAVSESAG